MCKLRQYGVDKSLMRLLYPSFIESVLTFDFVGWYGSLTVSHKTKLYKIVTVSIRIAGVQLNNMMSLYETRVLKRGKTIASDARHPFYKQYALIRSRRRFTVSRLQTRVQRSFVLASITLLDKHLSSLCKRQPFNILTPYCMMLTCKEVRCIADVLFRDYLKLCVLLLSCLD